MPPTPPSETDSERANDRVELLSDEQRSRVLFRLCDTVPSVVEAAIDSFEDTDWRWGE